MPKFTSPYFAVQLNTRGRMDREPPKKARPMGVDMTELAIARLPRVEDQAFRAFVNGLPCCVCGTPAPSEAAHVRQGMRGGLSRKPDDAGQVVPLCGGCHRTKPGAQHKRGERIWWQNIGIDPITLGAWLYEAYLADDRRTALHAIEQCGGARQHD
jgi:hypothetical protein